MDNAKYSIEAIHLHLIQMLTNTFSQYLCLNLNPLCSTVWGITPISIDGVFGNRVSCGLFVCEALAWRHSRCVSN